MLHLDAQKQLLISWFCQLNKYNANTDKTNEGMCLTLTSSRGSKLFEYLWVLSALQRWKLVQKLPKPEKLIQITFSEVYFHDNPQLLLQDSLAA